MRALARTTSPTGPRHWTMFASGTAAPRRTRRPRTLRPPARHQRTTARSLLLDTCFLLEPHIVRARRARLNDAPRESICGIRSMAIAETVHRERWSDRRRAGRSGSDQRVPVGLGPCACHPSACSPNSRPAGSPVRWLPEDLPDQDVIFGTVRAPGAARSEPPAVQAARRAEDGAGQDTA